MIKRETTKTVDNYGNKLFRHNYKNPGRTWHRDPGRKRQRISVLKEAKMRARDREFQDFWTYKTLDTAGTLLL